MRTAKFSYFQSLRFAWETWKHNVLFLAGIIFLLMVVASLPSLVSIAGGFLFEDPSSNAAYVVFQIFVFILIIVSYILQLIMGIGFIKILLNFCDQKKSTVSDLFRVKGMFWRYVGGVLLYGLLILAGMILFIVPGIYWAVRYLFVPYLLVDKKISIGDAFRVSSKLTKNTKWNFILFGVFIGLLNLSYFVGFLFIFFGGFTLTAGNLALGIILLVIGFLLILAAIFITMPIMGLAYVHAYRTIAYTTGAGFDADRQKGVTVSSGEHATKIVMVVVFVLAILFSIALAGWSIMRLRTVSYYPTQYQDFPSEVAPVPLKDYIREDGSFDAEAYQAALEEAYGSDSGFDLTEGQFDESFSEETLVELQ